MNVIALTGAFTAFLGANCHYSKRHQKGLAYPILGYMVMAMESVLQCWAVPPNDPRLL